MQRKIVALSEREKILETYRESGLTQEEFAKKHGLNVGTLRTWIYRSAKKSRIRGKAKKLRFVEVQARQDASRPVRLRLGHGIELEFEELPPPEYLAALARAAC